MKDIFDIQKALVKRGIPVQLNYSKDKNQFWLDLKTEAKSHLYLYEDLTLDGRYDYETTLVIEEWETEDDILIKLCYAFIGCLYGRTFYNSYWGDLCKEYGVKIPKLYI